MNVLSLYHPWWQSNILLGIWVIIAIIWFVVGIMQCERIKRKNDRLLNGQCVECGYDLRATPDRCPECGQIPIFAKE